MEKVQTEFQGAQPKTEADATPIAQPQIEAALTPIAQQNTQPAFTPGTQPAVSYYPTPPQPYTLWLGPNAALPPGHPCTLGGHIIESKFTGCGIAWAILCFPWGLICLFSDRRKYCVQCGKTFP
ncbi:hypothetical protein V1508DRAFT_427294 [Lipomyces doorenjongii]|uniref:uncharacterized protein n=1 Tax=Lipomyces doorenjongii TaxID=383834 RepID=UPI0034CE64AD